MQERANNMVKEILLLHHTHTDIGYTSPQPVIFELHKRYIEKAIDLVEKNSKNPITSKFKWNCEVTGITLDWWQNTTNSYRDKFLKFHKRGLIDVAGVKWHMTPLMDHQMLIDNLEPLKILRKEGMKINYAMDCDINGVPWGMVDALHDFGIKGFSMAINEFYGHALKPWPSGFYWQSKSGKKILAYNGPIYGATASAFLRIPFGIKETKKAIKNMHKNLKKIDYSHDFFMAQITNINHHDNAPPHAEITPFLKSWNKDKNNIPIRMVTITEFFERLSKQKKLPTMSGDWSDWWNFGAGSTPNETRISAEGQRALRRANILNIFNGKKSNNIRRKNLEESAKKSLGLYAEHTWGADRSINKPNSDETTMQWVMKKVLPYEGLSIARMLRRDGIENLASEMGGEGPTTIAFNSLPFKIKSYVKIPRFDKDYSYAKEIKDMDKKKSHLDFFDMKRWNDREIDLIRQDKENSIQRQDMTMPEISDDLINYVPIEVDAFSAVKIKSRKIKKGTDLKIKGQEIKNKYLKIIFEKKGGIKKIIAQNKDFILNNSNYRFGIPVLEYPKSKSRNEIFRPINVGQLGWGSSWNNKWKNIQKSGKFNKRTFSKFTNYLKVDESFTMNNNDEVVVEYKLFSNSETLKINVEIMKQPDSNPHALYLPMTVNTGKNPKFHSETAGATVELDKDNLPFSNKHFVTTQNWVSYHGEDGGVTIATKDCPLWLVGGLNYGKFDKNHNVDRSYKMVTPWLYNNYWNTNFLADQSGRIKFEFAINFEKPINLTNRIQNIMKFVHEPITHDYIDRGKHKLDKIKLFDVKSKNLYLTDASREKNISRLFVLNYSSEKEVLKLSSNYIKIKKVTEENLNSKLLKKIKNSKGSYEISFKPNEWKVIRIE